MNTQKPLNIDEYLSNLDPEKKEKLKQIRSLVLKTVPDVSELISYGMPAFKYKGRILIYFASFKNHVSVFPSPSTIAQFEEELKKYKGGKGTIQFADEEPLPLNLIERVIKFRALSIFEKNKK